jgi:hypothetical protein
MSPAPLSPEAVLCAAYRDQAEHYRHAAALAEALPALLRAGADHSEPLAQVMARLAEVATIEERCRPVKEQWVGAGGTPGAELRGVLTEVTYLIGRLASGLAEAEREAAARQERLAPQVDALIRGRAMRRAYQPTGGRPRA